MSDAAEKKWLITGQEQTSTGAEPKHILDDSNDIDEKEITERIIRWYQDHFYVQCKSPWNLGLELNEDSLWAGSKLPLHVQNFVGMMPLLGNTGRPEPGWVINITPHPGINPMEMLRAVMEGEDYYEQPELLQVRNFSPRKLAARRSGNWQSKERWDNTVLFGRIEGVGKLTLDGTPKDAFQVLGGSDKQASLLPAMSNLLGTLEIIEFVQKTKQLLQKNVLHTMERVEENLTGKVRGKILLNRQLRMNILRGQPQKVYCAYSRLSPNNRENIILRWALHLCENFSQGLADNLMDDIFSCKRALADVPLVKCGLQDFVGLKTNGAYREYKQALDAAKQIIGQFSITYTTRDEGGKKSSRGQERNSTEKTEFAPREIVPFFLDMNYLFELYCRAVLRRALDGEKLRSAKWRLEPKQKKKLFNKDLSTTFMHEYEPDMTVVDQAGKPVLVLDAKNTNVEENTKYRRDRTHQILFYMQALDCCFGILLGRVVNFPKESEDTKQFELIPLYRNGQPVAEGEAPNGWLSSLLFRQGSFEEHVEAMTAVLEQVRSKLIQEQIRSLEQREGQLQEILEKKNQRQKKTLKDSLQKELNNLKEELKTLEGSQNGRQ